MPAVAALMLLTPAQLQPARAQGAQATLSDSAQGNTARPPAPPPSTGGNVAAVDPANPQQKSLPARAIEKVKEVAKSAGDIFSRVPCLPPKGGVRKMGS
ncbi:MAG: SGNH/GDSL hydrolase family protein, partial [Bradyrhizobium sp.]|nr:SGNH/GDSL hydrolase family protein [Bradyrhizobium sp.]